MLCTTLLLLDNCLAFLPVGLANGVRNIGGRIASIRTCQFTAIRAQRVSLSANS
jgi:hypothetical protein